MFVGKVLKPIKTDIQTAPGSKLKFISSKCKTKPKNVCSKSLCSCQKHRVASAEVNHVEIMWIAFRKTIS